MNTYRALLVIAFLLVSQHVMALILIPIPNLGFPPIISKTRDALEISTYTKALATVGEDKVFGSRSWAYGDASGTMTQEAANAEAMRKCEVMLQNAKLQTKGGQPLFNFGSNRCELYKFANVTLSLPTPNPVATPAPTATPVATPAPTATPTPALASSTSSPTAAPEVKASLPSGDILQKMKNLEALYREKLITQEEYEIKKKQFLDSM